MDETEDGIGTKVQREIPYNKFLPYFDLLQKESEEQLRDIKAGLGRSIQFRDVKIGTAHWTGQLAKYIRLFGFKFTKEDHLQFIRVIFELVTVPDLDFSLIQKFTQVLIVLLKKTELLNRNDLTLPWRPLYKLIDSVSYSQHESFGLVFLPGNVENVLKNLIRVSKPYFSLESTAEMLDEWRPLFCPFDITMSKGLYFCDLFLPTKLPPEHHQYGFKLWFEEFIDLWEKSQNSPQWEVHMVNIFSRLACDTIGYIDWRPYLPQIFTRILRSFSLPVGSGQVTVSRKGSNYQIVHTVLWIVSMMGGEDNLIQENLNKLFASLESFYHPSNHGKWTEKLLKFMSKLTQAFVKRVSRERFEANNWDHVTPKNQWLTEANITEFVKSINPIVLLAMFSKMGPSEASQALQKLASLRPEIVIPPLLERTYPALETLTEPHRLTSCLHCVVAVARPMMSSNKYFPDGRNHVLPLLNLCLPGIDHNDFKKTLMTFQLISTLVSLVPIVDCSGALQVRSDLTDEEKELCSATTQFEDFVLQFMDRIFLLVENSAQDHHGSESERNAHLNGQQSMVKTALMSCFSVLMDQCSKPIYNEALQRMHRFVTSTILEVHVAGKLTSDLLRAVFKVDTEKALKLFVPHFCDNLIQRCTSEDLSKVEHLDHEFLWHLKMLSECVRCNGQYLVSYTDQLTSVMRHTLHMKCKDAAGFAGNLLRHTLRSLTMTYSIDFRSSATDWDAPLDTQLPIREWGLKGDLKKLAVKWHVPGNTELQAVGTLLQTFLQEELGRLTNYRQGQEVMDREELLQCLEIVLHCLMGAGNVLPVWAGEQLPLVESLVELKRFGHPAGQSDQLVTLGGQNVRKLVTNALRPLLDHLLESHEDDTKSLGQILKIYNCLMFYNGSVKNDFDHRWKSRRIVKKALGNKLFGKKGHLRAILVDRIQLQHELRVVNRDPRVFTELHREMFMDYYRLSTSRYSLVRKVAQQSLNQGMQTFSFSYRCLVDKVVANLKDDPNNEEHHFKGALHILLGGRHPLLAMLKQRAPHIKKAHLQGALHLVHGENKRSFMTKRSWDVMLKVWPALVTARHSEKPSIVKLIEEIMDKLQKNMETTDITTRIPDTVVEVAGGLWSEQGSSLNPSQPRLTPQELQQGLQQQEARNTANLVAYNKLVETLVDLAEGGTLSWKFFQICLDMLGLQTRVDAQFPVAAVRLFTDNLNNDSIQVRKMSLGTISALLKSQKRKHVKKEINVYEVSKSQPPTSITPGDRPDNTWHHYKSDDLLDTREKWEAAICVEKTHWGYYTWPKVVEVYAPLSEQPPLGRSCSELREDEIPIYEFFSNPDLLTKFLELLALEEQKGKDKFNSKHFIFFKGLFRNYDTSFLPLFKTHLERLVADTSHDKREYSHRLAAEIISGLIRATKHWDFDRVKGMWEWLTPVIKTGLSNMSVECIVDWGTCFATASESRDPRKLHFMFELLMDSPLSGEGGSFGDESRVYILQGALAQQEWRVPDLLHRIIDYVQPRIAHTYKSVRDRLGSLLVNVFMYDTKLSQHSTTTTSPHRQQFLHKVLSQLECLKDVSETHGANNGPSKLETKTSHVTPELLPSFLSTQHDLAASLSQGSELMAKLPQEVKERLLSGNMAGLPPQLLEMLKKQGVQVTVSTAGATNDGGMQETVAMETENGEAVTGGENGESEEHKTAIRLCKTVMKWLQGSFIRSQSSLSTEIYQFLPILCRIQSEVDDEDLIELRVETWRELYEVDVPHHLVVPMVQVVRQFCALQSETKDEELKQMSMVTLAMMAFSPMHPPVITSVMDVLVQVSEMSSWHARAAILNYLQVAVFCNFFMMWDPTVMQRIQKLVVRLLQDEQLEVREMAAVTLGGLLHCKYITLSKNLLTEFETLSRTKLKKKSPSPEKVLRRHAGVLGLCACVQAFPYDVPDFIPQILMDLSEHLNDPQSIQVTVKKTLSNFKRTHYDNWQDHKQKFTDDQLGVLTDLLVSPSYYA